MSDSGRYLGYDEDVKRWKEQDAIKLAEEVLQLRKENEELRQQLRDILAHPMGTGKGPILFCNSCGNPTLGRLIDHVCGK